MHRHRTQRDDVFDNHGRESTQRLLIDADAGACCLLHEYLHAGIQTPVIHTRRIAIDGTRSPDRPPALLTKFQSRAYAASGSFFLAASRRFPFV